MSKYFIFTLGCQMNISDSERLAQKLDLLGLKSASEKEADFIFVNACSVRQKAVDRIWGKIKIWQNNNKEIFVTGCILKADKNKFQKKGIQTFSIENLHNLQNILNPKLVVTAEYSDYFSIKPKSNKTIYYLPIMTGCDNFCAYCAVPYTRGREKSRPQKDIIEELTGALEKGYNNILFLGQNVNSYTNQNLNTKNQKPKLNVKDKNQDFIELLETIENLPYDFKFNFMSSNPHDMGDKLIECFSRLRRWPKELHLAMQSGDDEILKKMNRKYTGAEFLKLVSKLRSKIPELALSTDIIVGFPGETEKQFEKTVKICKKIGFDKAYVSQYSPRPGTPAAKLKDDIPKDEKEKRWLILDSLINR